MARLDPKQRRRAEEIVLRKRREANSVGEPQMITNSVGERVLDTRPGAQAVTAPTMRDEVLGAPRLYPVAFAGGPRTLPDAVSLRAAHFPPRNFGAGNEPALPGGVALDFGHVRGVIPNAKINELVWATREWVNNNFRTLA